MSSARRGNKVTLFQQHRASSELTDECIFDLLSSLDTPRSLSVWLLYSTKEHDQLTELEIEPSDYIDEFRFRDDYLATMLLSKAAFLETSFDKKDVAMKKFFKFEDLCRETNNRFRNLSLDSTYRGPNCWLLNATIRKIDRVLGDFCPEEMADSAGWGPGVTTRLKGSYVSAVNKFHSENGITRDLYSLVGDNFHVAYPSWDQHLSNLYGKDDRWSFEVGNRVVTVPKNSKTDRVIAIEPGINLWFQKGIGRMIRRRLLRSGIDLNTQENNQLAAYFSSKDGMSATVDFSSASDSISLELVRALLPPRWFRVLDSCRSQFGMVGNSPIRWEKFSSMGNGFTFELESLIFFCAACAVQEYLGLGVSNVTVFGDDVIIHKDAFHLFSEFSEFLGFKVNAQKSFFSGAFRESCGAHYYSGVDCKPLFIKERSKNVKAIYKLANGVRLLAHRRNCFYGCDRKLLGTWRHLYQRTPKPLRLKGPLILGDCCFSVNWDEAMPVRIDPAESRTLPAKPSGLLEGWTVPVLLDVGLTDSLDSPAVLMARLTSQSESEMNNSYTLRGRTKYSVKRVLVQQWYNFGGWF